MLGVSKALGWPTLHLLVPLPLYPRLFGSPLLRNPGSALGYFLYDYIF